MIISNKILGCALINVMVGPQRARHSSKCIRGMKMKSSQSIIMITSIAIFQSESFKNIIKSSL